MKTLVPDYQSQRLVVFLCSQNMKLIYFKITCEQSENKLHKWVTFQNFKLKGLSHCIGNSLRYVVKLCYVKYNLSLLKNSFHASFT
jgi:hypothetical protein